MNRRRHATALERLFPAFCFFLCRLFYFLLGQQRTLDPLPRPTHRHRQLTHRKFVASCGPLYQHTGEPFAVFHPSLIFSLFFPLGLLKFSKRALAFCFDLGLFTLAAPFLTLISLCYFRFISLSYSLALGMGNGIGFWAKPGCDFGGLGGRATAKFGGYGILRCFFGRTLWMGDGDGPHNRRIAIFSSPLYCVERPSQSLVSLGSGEISRRHIDRRRPRLISLGIGTWKGILKHRQCSLRYLAGRKSPAWKTSCDTPTRLTTTPFLCGTTSTTPSHSFTTTKQFDSRGAADIKRTSAPILEDTSREGMDELRYRQQRCDLRRRTARTGRDSDKFTLHHRRSHIGLSNRRHFSTNNNNKTTPQPPYGAGVKGNSKPRQGGLEQPLFLLTTIITDGLFSFLFFPVERSL
ncbi:uncharacterized protein B0H64DRAFT_84610 [Chaetomium fimeti]|jgi:hypothetical protein|uniref:Uncharacterized protein n=1 Tax=Chaetomium fimeti TaxID=1854472 RepID=A0AAE0HNI5_9PEZI|nr:hypothetical protein B0H64DRAFT_84610 [Chaetomium fimeti]